MKNGNNAHVDHHIFHNKNFGSHNMLLDLIFCTCTDNKKYEYENYTMYKSILNDKIRIMFIKH